MYSWSLLALYTCIGVVFCSAQDNYDVVGVTCATNEEVSCLMIKCPEGSNCPAEDFCYNPKCVCRSGYRKINGICMPKQSRFHPIKDEV